MRVNGEHRDVDAGPRTTLAAVLREQLELTSPKIACGRGECGSCTVLVAGHPRMSCITLAALVTEQDVTTAEGLAGENDDLRAEFADRGAFQCGFCTPGHIVHATALLRGPLPADPGQLRAYVRHRLSANICRCTGYQAIIDAVCAVAERRQS